MAFFSASRCSHRRKLRGKGMQIIKCTVSDVSLLAEMNKRLIEDERSSNTMSLDELKDRMSGFINGEYDAFFFKEDEAVVGYALVRQTVSPLYLRQFYIEREYRRRHLGKEAFEILLDFLKVNSIDIDVLPWNEGGRKFWKRMGFSETCISMNFRR